MTNHTVPPLPESVQAEIQAILDRAVEREQNKTVKE
jgi:hypothetical protein